MIPESIQYLFNSKPFWILANLSNVINQEVFTCLWTPWNTNSSLALFFAMKPNNGFSSPLPCQKLCRLPISSDSDRGGVWPAVKVADWQQSLWSVVDQWHCWVFVRTKSEAHTSVAHPRKNSYFIAWLHLLKQCKTNSPGLLPFNVHHMLTMGLQCSGIFYWPTIEELNRMFAQCI